MMGYAMATERQMAANRLNALRSTGPRTIEGRQSSSRNSLRHGLTARNHLIPGETVEQFDRFCDEMRAELQPQGPIEESLADSLSNTLWRLRRIPVLEAALFSWVEKKLAEVDATPVDPMVELLNWRPVVQPARDSGDDVDHGRSEQHQRGRLVEAINDKDFLSKLSRHEAHLVNQARKLIGELQQHVELRLKRDQSKLDAVDIEEN